MFPLVSFLLRCSLLLKLRHKRLLMLCDVLLKMKKVEKNKKFNVPLHNCFFVDVSVSELCLFGSPIPAETAIATLIDLEIEVESGKKRLWVFLIVMPKLPIWRLLFVRLVRSTMLHTTSRFVRNVKRCCLKDCLKWSTLMKWMSTNVQYVVVRRQKKTFFPIFLCQICFDDFHDGVDHICVLPCLHSNFHHKCLMQWLAKETSCPVCMTVIDKSNLSLQ